MNDYKDYEVYMLETFGVTTNNGEAEDILSFEDWKQEKDEAVYMDALEAESTGN